MKLDPKALEAAMQAYLAASETQAMEELVRPWLVPTLESAITAYLSNLQPSKEVRELVVELRAGLEGVTPGPWFATPVSMDDYECEYASVGTFEARGPSHYEDRIAEFTGENRGEGECAANSRHFARCSPENIKLLLDALSADLLSRMDGEGWSADREMLAEAAANPSLSDAAVRALCLMKPAAITAEHTQWAESVMAAAPSIEDPTQGSPAGGVL